MNHFLIVRHGETYNNQVRRLSGWIDTPLTENGLLPAQRVLQKLQGIKIDVIYSSDLGRAFITADYLARRLGYSAEIERLSGLREVNYGDAANMPAEQAYQLYPKLDRDTHFAPPNGESLDHMQARLLETVAKLNDLRHDQTILLVAHSGDMAALRSSFTGVDFGAHNISEAYPHDYVAEFTLEGNRLTSFDEILSK